MLTTFDWILAAVLCLGLPVQALWTYPRFRRRVASGDPKARVREYASIFLMEWTLVAVTFLLWFGQGRDLPGLGLGFANGVKPSSFWITAAVTGILIALLILNTRAILRSPEQQKKILESLGSVAELMPHSRHERRWFAALSVTAGICEEILYRGFLLWFCTVLVGVPGAVALTTLVFGAVHLYQGPTGGLRAAGLGLIMALLTVFSGSVWLAMVLHAAADLTSGKTVSGSLQVQNPAEPGPDPAAG